MREKKPGMPIGQGLLFVIILTLSLWAYSMILGAFGLREGCIGYLFLWFWSAVRGFEMEGFLADTINSCVGIACGCFAQWILRDYGLPIFTPAVFTLSGIVLFLSATKLVPMIVGDSTFLFMALLTGHLYLSQANYVDIAVSYLAGVVFFLVVITLIAKLFGTEKSKAELSE